MARFFLDPGDWSGASALTGAEAAHCARVMRADIGDRVEVFDGAGRSASAIVTSVSKSRVDLELGEIVEEPYPQVPVHLVIAVLKGKAMDLLIQKAVELGASSIIPVVCERTIPRKESGQTEKWRRTVLEACKQSGRSRMPEIAPLATFADAVDRSPEPAELRVIASLAEGAQPSREVIGPQERPQSLWILVGPEGDFTASETQRALETGWRPVSLGNHVLRSETAAMFLLSAAAYEFQ
ncbi:16S ribosomal RNA methyltransferase RsmE [Haloferula helveola]|uniref:Ribosomal RNA small subunit methyltransferase E n=1 Tax=Haloferula helveola TaxID=490095 RepID=A0ABN6H8Y4_9BACT|nr:16S ribosomal RNA methyltransferase RsmE [Haloferula helveola]